MGSPGRFGVYKRLVHAPTRWDAAWGPADNRITGVREARLEGEVQDPSLPGDVCANTHNSGDLDPHSSGPAFRLLKFADFRVKWSEIRVN